MDLSNNNRIKKYLLNKQHLLPESRSDSIIQVAEDLCGLHATCPATPYLSLFVRMNDFTKSDLKEEVEIKRSLIRTRSIRNTLHLLPVEKYFSVFVATRLQSEKRAAQYIKHLGLSKDEYKSFADKIVVALSDRGLTASEIKKETGNSKYTGHIINLLCDEGAIVRGKINGGWKSNNHRYYSFGNFFKGIDSGKHKERKVFEDFVLRYVRTYGPVKNTDIIWWSGLNKTIIGDILNNIGARLIELEIPESPGIFVMLKDDYQSFQLFQTAEDNAIHFLPAMDPYIMGYKNRLRFIDEAYYNYVFDRFGNAAPVILLNGEVIGIWDVADEKKLVKFFLFNQTGDKIYERIIEAGISIGRFYCDREVDIVEVRSVQPVKELTVGSFMSPLKNALQVV
jgi:hypothetical protein